MADGENKILKTPAYPLAEQEGHRLYDLIKTDGITAEKWLKEFSKEFTSQYIEDKEAKISKETAGLERSHPEIQWNKLKLWEEAVAKADRYGFMYVSGAIIEDRSILFKNPKVIEKIRKLIYFLIDVEYNRLVREEINKSKGRGVGESAARKLKKFEK